MSRLSPIDTSFLRVETETAHMHVGWLALLDLPAGVERLDVARVGRRIASRLHLVPRLRQKVVPVPMRVSDPVWRDAPDFRIEDHVREAELPAGGLKALVDDFLSHPLPRERPLWEIAVVPRLGGGRTAVLGKVHHAMVDGIAAVELGAILFDLTPEGEEETIEAWAPAPEAGRVRLAVEGVADTALEQFRTARRVVGLGRRPSETIRLAGTMRRAAFSLAEDALRPAPSSYLNVPIGPRRTLATHALSLSRLLAVKRAWDASLNDVVLAVCAGALRGFARRLGEEPEDLRVMVPVNRRTPGDGPDGNKVTFAFVPLPVGVARPGDRLRAVAERMAEVKTSGRIAGSEIVMGALGALPEPAKERAARFATSARLFNLTISNVPGPRVPLYVAGAKVTSIYPVIPIPDDHALAIGVLTYGGAAHFALYADPEALPRLRALSVLLEDALAELELARPAGARGAPAAVPV